MNKNFNKLNNSIIKCIKCKRLVNFRTKISIQKRKQYINEKYWGKPITGYGDTNAKILLVGLAPAAHGANRTGRVFTGDKSAAFLFKCLYNVGISNKPNSIEKGDGLKIFNCYITCALKCVPPLDKPTKKELSNCLSYFSKEISLLKNLKVILTLGRVAFETCTNYLQLDKKIYKFSHGANFLIKKNLHLFASYHPSPRNVNTKRINEDKMNEVFKKIKDVLKPHHNK